MTIVRRESYEDADLARRGLGRLEVAIRSTDRPTQSLPQALVLVRAGSREIDRITDQQGLARFDSLPVGDHDLLVKRLGYIETRVMVHITPGCRTDVEAYITVAAVGIHETPLTPSRVTMTICSRTSPK